MKQASLFEKINSKNTNKRNPCSFLKTNMYKYSNLLASNLKRAVLISAISLLGTANNYGTHFIIGFTTYSYNPSDYIGVSIMAPYDTNVTIFSNQSNMSWNKTVYIKEGESFEFKLPNSLRMDRSRFLQRGIEISSTKNISMFCLNTQSNRQVVDGYLALPSTTLGSIYVVASYQPYSSSFRASISVISPHNNNTIIVLPNENAVIYYRGQRYDDSSSLLYITQVLNKLEALYIYGFSDLSGTIVIASKPVTLLSSVDRVRTSIHAGFVESFLLPVSLWEYEYILTTVGPINGKQGDIFRIFAYENNTVVETGYWNKTLSSRMYAELVLGEDLASFAKCSKPCQVVQYIRQENAQPSMIVLPSVNHFLSYYRVILPYGSEYHDSLTITIENEHIEGLYMNGLKLNNLRWKIINGSNYVWSVVSLSDPNTVTVYHNSSAVKFGLLVFVQNNRAWYAYPGGFALGNYLSGRVFCFV